MKLEINIENKDSYSIPAQKDIEKAILDVLKEKEIEGSFEVDLKIVCKDEIRELNHKYRHIDKPTDVLSFPIHNSPVILSRQAKNLSRMPILLGDIIICPEMAEESIEKLIKHSVLHLLGFHHSSE